MHNEDRRGQSVTPVADDLDGSPILQEVLGNALGPMQVFHDKLLQEGIARGLIGPRDQGIIWERHILNSAALVPFLLDSLESTGGRHIADVGSGGGFPGIVLAACMPTYFFTLIEPMERRVVWLHEVVDVLGLSNVRIIRSRAEDLIPSRSGQTRRNKQSGMSGHKKTDCTRLDKGRGSSTDPSPDLVSYDLVTCRAVAPMRRLAGITLPLIRRGGRLIALKGRTAQDEIDKSVKEIGKFKGSHPRVCLAPVGPGLAETHVVLVDKS